jgi:hypothetical protein
MSAVDLEPTAEGSGRPDETGGGEVLVVEGVRKTFEA